MYGSLSESALEVLESVYDFTRCRRPDGSIYGSRGKCRKGTETVAETKPETAPKTRTPRLSKQEKIAIKVMADKSLRSDRKRIAEMVRLGVPKETDFVKLVSDAKAKVGLRAQDTVREAGVKAKPKTQQPPKSLAERMAAAAERLEKQESAPAPAPTKTKTKSKQVEAPPNQVGQTAAARVARPVDPKVAAKVEKVATAGGKAGKKPKLSPEEKAEQKWLAQKAKVEGVKAEHDKLIKELGKKGVKVYATGKGADTLNRMLKERGLPTQTQLARLQTKLRQQEPERLKQERLAKQRADNAAEIAGTSKEKRKEMILKELERLKGSSYVRTLKDIDYNVDTMQKWIRADPSADTLKNRVALTAMRTLRAEMARNMRQERRAKLESLESSLRDSPKYDKTPGSTKPADPKKLLGDYSEFLKKEKELDARRKGIENSGRLTDPKVQREYHDLLEEISMHSKGRIPGSPINLVKIYEAQGFNAKPELVQRRSDLESRKDILREPDGRPLILYRGVTEERFARQFQGAGPDGGKHYPGQGVYGNGTYAASVGVNVKNSKAVSEDNLEEIAQRTARSYATGGADVANRVTAFALRADANIVQFEETKDTPRYAAYSKWSRDILDQAEAKYGVRFNDHGEAAAAMGIHAYRVPMSDSEDYWVILNRGAVIASQDPELPN